MAAEGARQPPPEDFWAIARARLVAAFITDRCNRTSKMELGVGALLGSSRNRAAVVYTESWGVQATLQQIANHPHLHDALLPVHKRRHLGAWPRCLDLISELMPLRTGSVEAEADPLQLANPLSSVGWP